MVYPFKMVIFYSYVKLPEGSQQRMGTKMGLYGVFFKVLDGFMGRLWKFVVMNEGLTNKNDALMGFTGDTTNKYAVDIYRYTLWY